MRQLSLQETGSLPTQSPMRGLLVQEVGRRGKPLLCFPSFALAWAEPHSPHDMGSSAHTYPMFEGLKPKGTLYPKKL